jgi:serine/threonine-protein kinase HipA
LNVADSKITTVAGKDVLLVRRFDRDTADNGYRRHRMVSALTLLRSDDDPSSKENWSYLLLADEIRRTSASPKADLRELFARMCFNAIVSNLDDHPRNHAILAKDKDWHLSPAYDLTPSGSKDLPTYWDAACTSFGS